MCGDSKRHAPFTLRKCGVKYYVWSVVDPNTYLLRKNHCLLLKHYSSITCSTFSTAAVIRVCTQVDTIVVHSGTVPAPLRGQRGASGEQDSRCAVYKYSALRTVNKNNTSLWVLKPVRIQFSRYASIETFETKLEPILSFESKWLLA